MINLIIRLLQAGANFTWSVGFLAYVLGVDVQTIERWFQSAPQEQAQRQFLPPEAIALYQQVQQILETQHDIDALKRLVLTLPAHPDEGY